MATPEEVIAAALEGPQRVEVGDTEREQFDIKDMVAGAEYLDGKKGAKSKTFGLRFTQLNPPGAG